MTERLDETGDHIYKTWHTGDRELPIRMEDVSDIEFDYAEAHVTYSQLHKRVEGVNKECEVRYGLLAKLNGEFEDLHGKYEDVLDEEAVRGIVLYFFCSESDKFLAQGNYLMFPY